MFEVLRTKKVATAVVLLGGGLALAGCGNSKEGVGNVPLVRCGAHDALRSNSDSIAAVPKGEIIQLGQKIETDNQGDAPTGDFEVTSQGGGRFSVSIEAGGNNGNNTDVSRVPNYAARPNTATVVDHGELYTIAGTPGPQGSTSLTIAARCN